MEEKYLSFEEFKNNLINDEKRKAKVKKIKDDATAKCYWNKISKMSDKEFYGLRKENIMEEIEEFGLTQMTEADYDAEGFIVEYLKELESIGRKNNKSVCLRWVSQDEKDALDELKDTDSLKELGSYFTNHSLSDYNYLPNKKYLHFFPAEDYIHRDDILQKIDDENNPRTHLSVQMIDSNLTERNEATGLYAERDESHFNGFEEYAIPSEALNGDCYVCSVDIEKTGCHNYSGKEQAQDVLHGFYTDEELDNGDDYETDNDNSNEMEF